MNIQDKLAAARLRTRGSVGKPVMPYMSHVVLSLNAIEKPCSGTMGVDGYMRLYYDPTFVEKLSIDELAAGLLHEALHVVFLCHQRAWVRLGANPSGGELAKWNIAADLAVNDTLRDVPLTLPKGGCVPGEDPFKDYPRNQTTEQYYDLLPEAEAGSGGGGQTGKGGSCSDGQQRPWEDGPPEQGSGEGETQTPPGMTEYEQDLLRRYVAQQADEYQKQRGRGSLPGSMRRLADEILRPQVDPARELLAKCKYAVACTPGFGDFTYKRPNRRTPPGCAILPAHIQPVPRVTVIVDTSGSMDEKALALALGVIAQVVRALPNPRGVRVLTGDTRVGTMKDVFRPEQVELAGGGGTDMGAIIEECCDQRPLPNAIFVVTDGCTPWPKKPVRPHVVACLTEEPSSYPVPSWIQKVVLNPNPQE